MKLPFFALLSLVFIVGGSLYWQKEADDEQFMIDNAEQFTYISGFAEMILAYPASWEPTENSVDELDEGIYVLELRPPGHKTAQAAIEEVSGISLDNIEETIQDKEILEALALPQADNFGLLEVITSSGNVYEIYDNIDEWFMDYVDGIEASDGISISTPEEFEIQNGEAITFYTTIVEGEFEVRTFHVLALGVAAQVEATLYPASPAVEIEARDILSSMIITETLLEN